MKPVEISNYTIDGELAGEFTKRSIMLDTDDIVVQQNIVVIHNDKVYVLIFGSYATETSKPETNEIREHILKSIKWE